MGLHSSGKSFMAPQGHHGTRKGIMAPARASWHPQGVPLLYYAMPLSTLEAQKNTPSIYGSAARYDILCL